jgi:integrase
MRMSRRASDGAGVREPLDAAVARAICAWRPRGLSEPAQAFARAVVAEARPATPARARALLFAAAQLACFGESFGLAPEPALLLDQSVIERFALERCRSVSPATRRTLRTNLRALQRAVEQHPQPVALPRERAKPPYSDSELAGYLALAQAQPTEARRMRTQALVCLGAGAGIVAGELRYLRGSDVIERSGGLVVVVAGRRARVVPVLERYRERLLEAARFAGRGPIVGGREPGRRNLSDALAAALCADASLPRLEPGRLRSTWLCECARAIGLQAFMQAAGIRCSQRLGDLVAELPEVDEEMAVALLGGARGRGEGARTA